MRFPSDVGCLEQALAVLEVPVAGGRSPVVLLDVCPLFRTPVRSYLSEYRVNNR